MLIEGKRVLGVLTSRKEIRTIVAEIKPRFPRKGSRTIIGIFPPDNVSICEYRMDESGKQKMVGENSFPKENINYASELISAALPRKGNIFKRIFTKPVIYWVPNKST